jgi:hypothetical protein
MEANLIVISYRFNGSEVKAIESQFTDDALPWYIDNFVISQIMEIEDLEALQRYLALK